MEGQKVLMIIALTVENANMHEGWFGNGADELGAFKGWDTWLKSILVEWKGSMGNEVESSVYPKNKKLGGRLLKVNCDELNWVNLYLRMIELNLGRHGHNQFESKF